LATIRPSPKFKNSQPACGIKREVEYMASPWKFLSRLVSPKRGQKQDDVAIDEAKPDVLAIAGPTETPTEESLNSADQPADTGPTQSNSSDPVSADTAPLDEAESEVHDTAESVSADVAAADGLAPSDETDIAVVAAPNALKLEPAVEGTARKQTSGNKKTEAAVVVAQVSAATQTVSDTTMSLDDEIRVLRAQLASKLRTQNAQLKKMLERFER
jgi:hypothetical protein